MRIEIDQSGKIEQMNRDTVISFSNGCQYSVIPPKSVKEQVYRLYKSCVKNLRYKLFCIGIYHCIKGYLFVYPLMVIDSEYARKENLIKSILLHYVRKMCSNFDAKNIRFGHITKKSNAHMVAIDVFRKNRKPKKIVTFDEVRVPLEK